MIALITGASAGFGAETTKLLIEKGHYVIGTGRREKNLLALQNELGDHFYPLAFDICDETAMDKALASLPDEWKHIDLLVNNAGLALGLAPAYEADLTDWQKMVDTNIMGLIRMTRKILPSMVASNKGHIINIASTAGNYPYYGSNVYGASKAFVKQFSLNLRADLLGKKIRVSNLEPGLIAGTEFSNVRFHGDDEKAAAVYENVDNMTAQDIAEIIVWMAELPAHINVNRLEVMPTVQTFAGLTVSKENI